MVIVLKGCLEGLSWGVGSSSSCASSCLGGLAHLHLATCGLVGLWTCGLVDLVDLWTCGLVVRLVVLHVFDKTLV